MSRPASYLGTDRPFFPPTIPVQMVGFRRSQQEVAGTFSLRFLCVASVLAKLRWILRGLREQSGRGWHPPFDRGGCERVPSASDIFPTKEPQRTPQQARLLCPALG